MSALEAPGRTYRHGTVTVAARWHRPAAAVGAQRRVQVALGLIWLLDGALQLQPFMFSPSFVTQIIAANAIRQPGFVAAPVTFMAHLIEPRVVLFNAFAATIQLLIGLGLIYRPTVRAQNNVRRGRTSPRDAAAGG